MPIPTPEPPVTRLAEEVACVRVAGGRPRVHGNGFIQLDLSAARRLHVWGDPRIPRQAVPSQIHDHTFSFTSTIVSGQIVHRAFAVTNAVDGAYRLYQAVTRHGEDTRLVEQPGRYLALIAEERLLRAGDAYTFAAGQFHETVAPWPCVTIIEKDGPSLAQGGPSPRVLVPADLTPDNEFDRYGCASTDLLWQVIDDALAGRSEVEALLLQRAQEIAELQEREALKLAACDVAALSNTRLTFAQAQIERDNPAWSVAYVSVRNAVEREIAHREALTARAQEIAELRAELEGRLSEAFRESPSRYDTPTDHYREMARRINEDRDEKKHQIRQLEAQLAARAQEIEQVKAHSAAPLPASAALQALPDLEVVAAAVHEQWIAMKRSQGVTSRRSETGEELMVPYSLLSDAAKDLDRTTVRTVYDAIQQAGTGARQ